MALTRSVSRNPKRKTLKHVTTRIKYVDTRIKRVSVHYKFYWRKAYLFKVNFALCAEQIPSVEERFFVGNVHQKAHITTDEKRNQMRHKLGCNLQ